MDFLSSNEFDNVKAEKAKALHRYQRSRKLKTLAHALELLVAVLLLSWYSSRLSSATGDFLRRLASLVTKPLVVFLISNGIIVIILFLAGKNDVRHEASGFYEEYLSVRRASSGGSPGTMAALDQTYMDKQIGPSETAPAHEKIITEVPGPDPLPSTVDPSVEKEADKEDAGPRAIPPARPAAPAAAERRYQRTRSEVTVKEEQPRAELRRSATGIGRPEPSSSAVEDLSDEEFNLTVEKYIAKTKLQLKGVITAEDTPLSFHSVAVN